MNGIFELFGDLLDEVSRFEKPMILGGKGLPDWLALGNGPRNGYFALAVCAWLGFSYWVSCDIGKRFEWTPIQVLQVFRSGQCALFSGLGLFSMGALHGAGTALSAQCNDDIFVVAIINYFGWYFLADLFIMVVVMKHYRKDLLVHHAIGIFGILGLVYNGLYPCSAGCVAVSELMSLFSGVEAMLPSRATDRSRGEEHIFHVIRSYRLAILILVRPFMWQHVRLSATDEESPLKAALYMVPGTLLPLLDVTWAWKIARSLFPGTRIDKAATKALSKFGGGGGGGGNGHSAVSSGKTANTPSRRPRRAAANYS